MSLIDGKMTAEAAHPVLEQAVGYEDAYRFHVYLIEHGRRVCKAPRPRCGECVLNDICPSSLVREEPKAPASAQPRSRPRPQRG